jgi:hypothetical protein
MKAVQRWMCDYCHAIHETEEDCRDCESQHIGVAKMEPDYGVGDTYPRTINVRFKDGSVRSYIEENYI